MLLVTLMRIRILLVNLIRIRVLPYTLMSVNLDPDPSFQIKAQNFEKVLHTFWLVLCKLMRIRIQLTTLMRIPILPLNLIQADPDKRRRV